MANEIISMLSREDLLLLYPVGRIIESAVAINLTDLTTLFPGTEWKELSELTKGYDCFTATYSSTHTEPTITSGELDLSSLTFGGDNASYVLKHTHTGSTGEAGSHYHIQGTRLIHDMYGTGGYGIYGGCAGSGTCNDVAGRIGGTNSFKHDYTSTVANHSHSVTISTAGTEDASNTGNMPKYLAVHKYIRTK